MFNRIGPASTFLNSSCPDLPTMLWPRGQFTDLWGLKILQHMTAGIIINYLSILQEVNEIFIVELKVRGTPRPAF